MHLSDHRLSQLDEADVQALDEARLRGLSLRRLDDLKEARERLRQNPTNRSRPPSRRAPWDRPSAGDAQASDEAGDEEAPDEATTPAEDPPGTPETHASEHDSTGAKQPKPKRKAGKQPGAPGFGRTQVLQAQETRHHHPGTGAGCAETLPADAPRVADAGFQSVDLVWGNPEQPGLHLQVTDHRLDETACACGHHTRARPGEGVVEDPTLAPVTLSEWRLVGPGLATLIVALHLRFRLSRRRMRAFLHDWLGLSLSVGTLDRTLREAAAASAPLEQELIDAVVASDLLHADETSWPQGAELRWLWVFTRALVHK